MKKKKTILILAVFIIFIALANLSFAQTPCSPACDDKTDCDEDGHDALECGGDDCDDNNTEVYDKAPELCDGLDNDCDGEIPNNERDLDEDGFAECEYDGHIPANDCDDNNAEVYDKAPELCDGLDNDCDGEIPNNERDLDEDGFAECEYDGHIPANDCDDNDPDINPDATEICNNTIDDDCDGDTDCADSDCDDDPTCPSQPCAPEGDACNNTEECCDELKCKKQIDSPKNKICCSKDDCAAIEGCVEENTCTATTIYYEHKIAHQKVCAHGTWIPETTTEHNCNDEIDNDCDEFIDCGDTDCGHMPTCQDIKCKTDEGCNSYQTCKNGRCRPIVCKGCAHPEDHTCQKWDCCGKKDCNSGEMCWKHECIEAPENSATKKKYIKENARSYIDEAEQKILDKKNIKPTAGEIKILEKKLNRAKSAYSSGRYEEAESLATETITGYKQRKTIIENINAFLYKIKLLFVREKKSEPEKQYAYASKSDFALQ